MAKRVMNDERRVEQFLKVLVETTALQMLFSRWIDINDEENYEWQVKMEVLSEVLEKKLHMREKLVDELGSDFPEIVKFDWTEHNH